MRDEDKTQEQLILELAELRQQNAALEKERDVSYRYLDDAAVMAVVINADQRVSFVNKNACNVLRRKKEDILGKNWFDTFIPAAIREEVKTIFSKLMSGQIEPVEYFDNAIIAGEGEERIVAWHNTVIKDETGRITGTFSIGEDITGRKKMDVERDRLIHKLTDELNIVKTLKMRIPVCALSREDFSGAIKEHYECLSREGKCTACLRALK